MINENNNEVDELFYSIFVYFHPYSEIQCLKNAGSKFIEIMILLWKSIQGANLVSISPIMYDHSWFERIASVLTQNFGPF